jgi:hypothetical protein
MIIQSFCSLSFIFILCIQSFKCSSCLHVTQPHHLDAILVCQVCLQRLQQGNLDIYVNFASQLLCPQPGCNKPVPPATKHCSNQHKKTVVHVVCRCGKQVRYNNFGKHLRSKEHEVRVKTFFVLWLFIIASIFIRIN